jgi:hypothetical protein
MKCASYWEEGSEGSFYRSSTRRELNVGEVYQNLSSSPKWNWIAYQNDEEDFSPCLQGKSSSRIKAQNACDKALIEFGWKIISKRLLVMG